MGRIKHAADGCGESVDRAKSGVGQCHASHQAGQGHIRSGIQIAGLIARRIVCWVKEGQRVQAGERIGLIRFGSQVDMVMPKEAKLRVKAGDFVTAGDTVLADL